MVYITIHRPDAIPRLLQLGADLVHGVVKGAGQAVEAMPATIPLRKVHVFIVFTSFSLHFYPLSACVQYARQR